VQASAFALYNGNVSLPMMPQKGVFISENAVLGFKAGYELDWVYNCHLKLHTSNLPKNQVHDFNSLTQFAVLTLNFIDRVEIFGNLGSLSCHWNHQVNSTHKISYQADPSWAWSIGGRAILAYWGELQFGVNASYLQSHPSLSSLKVNGESFSHKGSHIHLNPWGIGAGVSYRFCWFLPYIGINYLNQTLEVEDLDSLAFFLPKEKTRFKINQPMGPEVGFNVNVEARVINEYGCSVSADFKF